MTFPILFPWSSVVALERSHNEKNRIISQNYYKTETDASLLKTSIQGEMHIWNTNRKIQFSGKAKTK